MRRRGRRAREEWENLSLSGVPVSPLSSHRHRALSSIIYHGPTSMVVPGGGVLRENGCACALCLCHGPGISAFCPDNGSRPRLLLGNRNNKPVLIVSRDGQGMSRQSVLAAPRSAAAPLALPQAPSSQATVGSHARAWSTLAKPGPPAPALSTSLPPYQSSFLKLCCRIHQKPFITCVIASASTPAATSARSRQPAPVLPTVASSRTNTHSRCLEEVCAAASVPFSNGAAY